MQERPACSGDASAGGALAPPAVRTAEHLERFCTTVLDLLRQGPGGGPALAPFLQHLVQALGPGSRSTLAHLRREIGSLEAGAEHLRHLACSPLLDVRQEVGTILARLDQAREQAERVANAMEALQLSPHSTGEKKSDAGECSSPLSPHGRGVGGEGVERPSTGRTLIEEPAPAPPIDDRNRAAGCYQEAEQCRRAADFEAAVELYTEALRLDPSLRPAYLHRGRIRTLQGQTDLATDDFASALQLGTDAVAYWWRGDAHAVAGHYEDAVADYTWALELRPDLFLIRYNRAVALRQAGDLDTALDEFHEMIRTRPGHAPSYLNRGLVYLARGNLSRAAAEFRVALHHHPRSREAQERLEETEALLRQLPPTPAEEPPPPAALPVLALAHAAPPATEPSVRAAAPSTQGALGPRNRPATFSYPCPACGKQGLIRWSNLTRGKVLSCSHCRKNFTSNLAGHLVEVVQDREGRWVERRSRAAQQRLNRWRRFRLLAAGVAVALVVYGLSWAPRLGQASATGDPELPQDLEPRAELFARAWLKGDYRMLRQLTDPVQDRLLFPWYRRHPPPLVESTNADEPAVQIQVMAPANSTTPTALRVRFDGLRSPHARSPLELQLAWEERGGSWYFKPDPS
jgi:tetratricopeptide (TPR) repeat protein